jgi:hypothetical protein
LAIAILKISYSCKLLIAISMLVGFYTLLKFLNGCIALRFNGYISVLLNPFHMLYGVRVFFSANETHCVKYSFFITLPLFANVQTSMYAQSVVFNELKQKTSNDYNVWNVCDGKVIKSNTLLFGQYWPWHGVCGIKNK